jgi:dienelactone hydrolase
MRRVFLAIPAIALAIAVAAAATANGADENVDDALAAFWDARSPIDAEKVVARIVATGVDFDGLFVRLRAGRSYASKPTGMRSITYPKNSTAFDFDNLVAIPSTYDPARKWPLRVQLHGGISRPAPNSNDADRLTTRIPSGGEIEIHPRGWVEAMWWHTNQLENIFRVLDEVKRTYNVDESGVYVTGISDGGTGVYYLAMRAATPWAACLPLNGNIAVLANPDSGVEGELFFNNLVNCPFHIVNGGKDRLYPAAYLTPYIDLMRKAGVPLVWQVYKDAGHDTSWWPVERPQYEGFVGAHAREAHPDHVSWETERVDRYNRIRWLVIDSLGVRPSDSPLTAPAIGTPEAAALRRLVSNQRRSGRVDIVQQGNVFDAKTRGVREFTLLLSPDAIDFARPVKVTVNGKTAFDGTVKKDVATLLNWAARDNDRSMLYGAELKVAVP